MGVWEYGGMGGDTRWWKGADGSLGRRPMRAWKAGGAAGLALVGGLAVGGCGMHRSGAPATAAAASRPAIRYQEVTRAAGIRFRHVNGGFGRKWMPETMGSGCAFVDYDNDGNLDVFCVNSSYWPGHRGPGRPTLALYRNRGDGTFIDVTARTGLDVEMYGMGVAVGDYDGDGYDDLYVTGLQGSRLFRNERGRRFRDVTSEAGVGGSGWATSAAWLDYDRDGYLDLFVCHYVRWTPATDVEWSLDGVHKTYTTPNHYPGESCRLYRNLGPRASGPRFADVTREAGIESPKSKALGVATCDYDEDGWPDIAVSNDTEPNFLYHNQGNGTFKEVGVELGVAVSEAGRAKAGMGIDTCDLMNDGHEAILVTNFSGEQLALYRRDDFGLFLDVSARSGVGPPSQVYLGFGAFFFDCDMDGWQDIFVLNGHIQDDIGVRNTGVTFAERPLLFRNLGGPGDTLRFEEISEASGPDLMRPVVGRGASFGDYDNDGDLDLLETTNNGAARLLRCNGRPAGGWLRVVLHGAAGNTDAFGARVRARVGGRTITRYVRSGSSYLSQSDRRLLFGLGAADRVEAIEIRWPDGSVQTIGPARRGETVEIRQGERSACASWSSRTKNG
jgi:hypothetical protein